jgi:integrase
MARGDGSLYKRGEVWQFAHWTNEVQTRVSTGKKKLSEARTWRDKFLGRSGNREADKILCGELLDDVLAHVQATGKASTAKIWGLVIEANLRPFFGHLRAATVNTETLRNYREARIADGRSNATANRELSILRTSLHLGRKQTPPKVTTVPYFPMTSEQGNARQGFLTDEQYAKLRDALPDYLKPLFVVAYFTGIRKGELLAIRVSQVDLLRGIIDLRTGETKNKVARIVPILDGDMRQWVEVAVKGQDDPHGPLFHREGQPIKDFRGAWETATTAAGVPDLHVHDLRRSASRFMRNAGVVQSLRMRIMGHLTDSMDRRYGIIDDGDIMLAAERMNKAANKA